MTYTYAHLEVLPATYWDVRSRLETAEYHHAIDQQTGVIDMHGIALVPLQPSVEVVNERVTPEAVDRLEAARGSRRDLIVDDDPPSPHTTLKSFRHYKGGTYTLLMIGRNSEARDELFAVYVSHETQQVWIRPWAMFTELVRWPDDIIRPRFSEISP